MTLAPWKTRGWKTYRGPESVQVALPLGGLGAGCVSLTAYGALQDFAVRNRPHLTALSDGHGFSDAAFALLHVRGKKPVTRLVEGPFPLEKVYDQGLQGQGYRKSGHEGLPRFAKALCRGAFPALSVMLEDPAVPLRVTVTGWSPFVPNDDLSSGLPCAILEYRLENRTGRPVDAAISFHVDAWTGGVPRQRSRNVLLPGRGTALLGEEDAKAESFGSNALGVAFHAAKVKAMWFRGGWFDGISALWREAEQDRFQPNDGSPAEGADLKARNGGSVWVDVKLAPGETATVPFILAWHFPNVHGSVGAPKPAAGSPGCGCTEAKAAEPSWRPFYAGRFADAGAVVEHVLSEYERLRARTQSFQEALLGSTLPAEALDAISANLAILKSPTVLRQENGNVWGWEGCFPERGCCHGSCTHVWNYAQALAHLFAPLERTLREGELLRSMDERGHVTFRAALPDGPTAHEFHPAADGQLGGLVKLCREWRVSGDDSWLRRMYPHARRDLDFCIATWDPKERGAVEEPHHNTYDIEFWGPTGMCTSMYAAALWAAAEMADALGELSDEARYRGLAHKALAVLDEELFNGAYYQQVVRFRDLRNQSLAKQAAEGQGEAVELLRREGPKYQYGSGCLSDGIIGAWLAWACGLDVPFHKKHVVSTLKSIYKHNYRADLFEHANLQRPGYALGHEGGLLLCTWPHGGKPTLPFPYSDEVWTGIEYQVASHMIAVGLVKEGLEIVKTARARYSGRYRNPFNEYECGNFYARAMASYALLPALSGFAYDARTRELKLAPRIKGRVLEFFFSTAAAWGTVRLDGSGLAVRVIEGRLEIAAVSVNGRKQAWSVTIGAGETVRKGF